MATDGGRFADILSGLAAVVQSSDRLDDAAEHVLELAQDNLECDYAGITIRHPDGRLDSLAVTGPLIGEADRLQHELREGPCVDALTEQRDFGVDDIATDPRWPRWGPAAAGLGLRSLLAVRMTSAGGPLGALNLYSTRQVHFTDDEVAFAHVFAHQAATALNNMRRIEQLQVAVDGRTLIGQAQGVLMERFVLTPDQAFSVLRRYSQDNNVKLRVVAEELIQTGSLRQSDESTAVQVE